jgi:hypothetical protein
MGNRPLTFHRLGSGYSPAPEEGMVAAGEGTRQSALERGKNGNQTRVC